MQKKLLIKDYETLKNMGLILSVDKKSRGIYGNDYYIKIKNNALNHININDLKTIVFNKFMGYYGGTCILRSCDEYIFLHVDAWND